MQRCMAKDVVHGHMAKLTELGQGSMSLTERELALLSVAIAQMCRAGLKPYSQRYIIQVDFWLSCK